MYQCQWQCLEHSHCFKVLYHFKGSFIYYNKKNTDLHVLPCSQYFHDSAIFIPFFLKSTVFISKLLSTLERKLWQFLQRCIKKAWKCESLTTAKNRFIKVPNYWNTNLNTTTILWNIFPKKVTFQNELHVKTFSNTTVKLFYFSPTSIKEIQLLTSNIHISRLLEI